MISRILIIAVGIIAALFGAFIIWNSIQFSGPNEEAESYQLSGQFYSYLLSKHTNQIKLSESF